MKRIILLFSLFLLLIPLSSCNEKNEKPVFPEGTATEGTIEDRGPGPNAGLGRVYLSAEDAAALSELISKGEYKYVIHGADRSYEYKSYEISLTWGDKLETYHIYENDFVIDGFIPQKHTDYDLGELKGAYAAADEIFKRTYADHIRRTVFDFVFYKNEDTEFRRGAIEGQTAMELLDFFDEARVFASLHDNKPWHSHKGYDMYFKVLLHDPWKKTEMSFLIYSDDCVYVKYSNDEEYKFYGHENWSGVFSKLHSASLADGNKYSFLEVKFKEGKYMSVNIFSEMPYMGYTKVDGKERTYRVRLDCGTEEEQLRYINILKEKDNIEDVYPCN